MKLSPRARTRPSALPARIEALNNIGPIVQTPIDQLKNYKTNPRKHPEKQIVKIMASVSRFGIALPVLVDTEFTIIAGEAVTEAARRLGYTSIPVIVAGGWSEARIQAFRLAANRLAELATWDTELLVGELTSIIEIGEVNLDVLGWETGEIDVMFEGAITASNASAGADPDDEQLAPPSHPVTRPGDLWQLGDHRLLCGSSLDASSWTALMEGREAAMVITDAPYNVRVTGHIRGRGKVRHAEFAMASGEMSSEEFTSFLTNATRAMADAARDGALLYLFMDWRHQVELHAAIRSCNLSQINLCVWNKGHGGQGSLYRSQHELVIVAKKGTAPHTNNVQLGRHGRYRTNCWSYPGVNSFSATRTNDLADHPTVKPTTLVADAIRDVTHPGEIVIDGFMGSGTTILAAERTKRLARGIEIEPAYVDVAIRRWEKRTGRQAVRAATGETFAEVASARAIAPADGASVAEAVTNTTPA